MALRFVEEPGVGRRVCSQGGRRVMVFCLPVPSARPIVAVRRGGEGMEVKSARLGPALRRSRKVVGLGGDGGVGGVVDGGEGGEEIAVANERLEMGVGRRRVEGGA